MASWIVTKTRNVTRGLMQRHGTRNIKERMWDREFSQGRWDCLDRMPGDCLYPHVERYANHGSVLDLGCGPGTTGTELAEDSYASYTGVDISHVAVDKAIKRAQDHGRAGKNSYFQSDLFSYVPAGLHDVILFGDSIYYVPWAAILTLLDRYSAYLKSAGVFVVRMYGLRYQKILQVIESHFDVVERHVYGDVVFVLIFRPRS